MKKLLFLLFFLGIGSLSWGSYTTASSTSAYIDSHSNRTMVPLRFVSEKLGANVQWNGRTQTIDIKKENKKITLTINHKIVEVNHTSKPMDVAPVIKVNTTYVPIRMVTELLDAQVSWNSKTSTVRIEVDGIEMELFVNRKSSETSSKKVVNDKRSILANRTFKVGSEKLQAKLITVDLKKPNVKLKVAIAKDRVGSVDQLSNIAKRNHAQIAINGSFFSAYSEVKEPYGLVISDGKIVNIGRQKTVFSFDRNKNINFEVMNPKVKGATNGSYTWPDNWYAYWFNRTPRKDGTSVVIFTPERGKTVGFNYGTNVIVENGVITAIATGNVQIPRNGFVINLTGSEKNNLIDRFKVGKTIDYRIEMENDKSPGLANLEGAIGVGPRLITNGEITVNPITEGFDSPKILKLSGARSAIGITNDNKLLLLTTRGATIQQLAKMMKQAGAYQAMNLDGCI